MRPAAGMLIVAGFIVMFYPFLNSAYTTYKEEQLLKDWQEAKKLHTAEESYLKLEEVYQGEELTEGIEEESNQPIGALTIEKINLTIPVLDGANQSNLKVAAGKLEGTDDLDEKMGNTAIAAHRSYTYGKQFNRLDEVEIGNEIVVQSKKEKKTYTVYNKMIVEPTDVSVLESVADEKIITLITCEPIREATHRLIIQAK